MNQYFEQMIMSASPVELIRLLYKKAVSSVKQAREHLAAGRIMERGEAINKAYLVIVELGVSLKADEAPEMAARLGDLYTYMQNRLLEANVRQQDRPLAEVLSLLTTLSEAWEGIPDAEPVPVVMNNRWANQMADEPVRYAMTA